MLKLEDIRKDAAVNGIAPSQVVRVVTTEPVGDNALRACLRSVKQLLLQRLSMKEAPHAPALSQRCVTETV